MIAKRNPFTVVREAGNALRIHDGLCSICLDARRQGWHTGKDGRRCPDGVRVLGAWRESQGYKADGSGAQS